MAMINAAPSVRASCRPARSQPASQWTGNTTKVMQTAPAACPARTAAKMLRCTHGEHCKPRDSIESYEIVFAICISRAVQSSRCCEVTSRRLRSRNPCRSPAIWPLQGTMGCDTKACIAIQDMAVHLMHVCRGRDPFAMGITGAMGTSQMVTRNAKAIIAGTHLLNAIAARVTVLTYMLFYSTRKGKDPTS